MKHSPVTWDLFPDNDTWRQSLICCWYLKLGLSIGKMEMLELPQQSIEEGVWEIKEVEMLEWTY